MSDDVTNDLIDSLTSLLEDERTALIEGKLDALEGLLSRKEALFEELEERQEEDSIDPESLAPLQDLFRRNHALLESTQKGLRATTERMGAMRRVRTSLETYTPTGQRHAVQMSAGQRVEKRA
ncbi:flagellar biosynthesis protein FlgN [Shimia sp. R9_1]|uniref:flagellar biosynthesis protein FlgN n=1 Tax=unclassified Shimia TaxID=2630038 RepID=UPI001AD9CC15|nr:MULTISPECIES: flagellar biosynthesis protein FlgN [unclassified Shimia]MBO9395405.1 flagellar biosynthesis protein FlgN [Shimia sp. R9_2]MBO9407409.1 flagellar biosynthesis protein FlgN [Shimia sp. R9_1]